MAGCFALAATGSGQAQSAAPQGQDDGVGGLLERFGFKEGPHAPAPDFVRRSRPAEDQLHYIPVGTPHPAHADKILTPAEVAAETDRLDQLRIEQQRRAGVKPVPVPSKESQQKSAAAKPLR